jgi:hypothetical protein
MHNNIGKGGSSMTNTIMGTFSPSNRFDDDDDNDAVVNIAPQRGRGAQAIGSDAHAREVSNACIYGKRGGSRRRHNISSSSGDVGCSGGFLVAISGCVVVFHTIVKALPLHVNT